MIVGFKKELFKEYLGDGSDFGVNITYILQPTLLGIAAAVELARDYIREPFVITLSDDLTIAKSLDNLINDFWIKKAKIVEGVVFEKDVEKLRQACCLTLNNEGEITDITEKPTHPTSQVRGCGIYICDPNLFDFIAKTPFSPPRNEKEITNTIKLVAQEHCAYGSFIDGVNININKVSDLLEAMHLLMEKEKAL
jgi:dTDP-glucose pyrophosphorylase